MSMRGQRLHDNLECGILDCVCVQIEGLVFANCALRVAAVKILGDFTEQLDGGSSESHTVTHHLGS